MTDLFSYMVIARFGDSASWFPLAEGMSSHTFQLIIIEGCSTCRIDVSLLDDDT